MTESALSQPPKNLSKDLSLEALRGMASLAVLAWHFLFAFAPWLILDPDQGLAGSPFYAFFHGSAAAALFFLLSGYVLTRRYFDTPKDALLIVGACKRWFRLMPLALLSVLLSWCLYRFGLYGYVEAGRLSHSSWLVNNGGVYPPPTHESLVAALYQGTIGTFFLGQFSFNSNLWTMHVEIYGSLMAFAFAAYVQRFRDQGHMVALGFLLSAAAMGFFNLRYIAFILGTLLAAYTGRQRALTVPAALFLLATGLFAMGYRVPLGLYAFMRPLSGMDQESLYVFTSMIGGALVLIACTECPALHRAMQNRGSQILGQLSFPLYVLHIPLIGSVGSWAFVAYAPLLGPGAIYAALAAVVAAILPLAFLLAALDRWWVAKLRWLSAQTVKARLVARWQPAS